MAQNSLNAQHLALIGGGHSHVAVLKALGERPVPGVRVTMISREPETLYSGMLPGLIAGHYSRDQAHIDLEALTRFAGADGVVDEALGLDLVSRQIHRRNGKPVAYDLLSIDVGSTPNTRVPGAEAHAVPVKPIDRFLAHWEALHARLQDGRAHRIAVVGGGAGGVELLLSVQHRMRQTLEAAGRDAARLTYHLFTSGPTILPTHNPAVQRIFGRILERRGVIVHAGCAVAGVEPGHLRTAAGTTHDVDEVLWTTEASAAAWLGASGLAVDGDGFVCVSGTLESVSHPGVFAAGDVAALVETPVPKSGVFAVRQGAVLARNLRRALTGRPMTRYTPQRRFLNLISTGDRYAVASRGGLALEGAWVWRWKDWIDRRFVREYADLGGQVAGRRW